MHYKARASYIDPAAPNVWPIAPLKADIMGFYFSKTSLIEFASI